MVKCRWRRQGWMCTTIAVETQVRIVIPDTIPGGGWWWRERLPSFWQKEPKKIIQTLIFLETWKKRRWLFSFWHVLFTIKTMFWSMHHLYAHQEGGNFNRITWSGNSHHQAAPQPQHILHSSFRNLLYRNMTATNAMIFSLGCILYSKLSRSLYKPLFHTLYWLDGGLVCCMVRGCDKSWRMPHVENQNKKKTWQT